jgi:hypothetical protein
MSTNLSAPITRGGFCFRMEELFPFHIYGHEKGPSVTSKLSIYEITQYLCWKYKGQNIEYNEHKLDMEPSGKNFVSISLRKIKIEFLKLALDLSIKDVQRWVENHR